MGRAVVPGISRRFFWGTYFVLLGATIIYAIFIIARSVEQHKNPSTQIGITNEKTIPMPAVEVCEVTEHYRLDCANDFACQCYPPVPKEGALDYDFDYTFDYYFGAGPGAGSFARRGRWGGGGGAGDSQIFTTEDLNRHARALDKSVSPVTGEVIVTSKLTKGAAAAADAAAEDGDRELRRRSATPSCPATATAQPLPGNNGTLEFGNYVPGAEYLNSQDCRWTFVADAASCATQGGAAFVKLTFDVFSTESGFDFVQIFEGSETSLITGTLKHQLSGEAWAGGSAAFDYSTVFLDDFVSSTSTMSVRFVSDASVRDLGFNATVTTVCQGGPTDCAAGCLPGWEGDGICDLACLTPNCNLDATAPGGVSDCAAELAIVNTNVGSCTSQIANPNPRSTNGGCYVFNSPKDIPDDLVIARRSDEDPFMNILLGGFATSPAVPFTFQGYSVKFFHPDEDSRFFPASGNPARSKGVEYAMPTNSIVIASVNPVKHRSINGKVTWEYNAQLSTAPMSVPRIPQQNSEVNIPCSVAPDSRDKSCTTTILEMQVASFTITKNKEFVPLDPLAVLGALGGFWSICAGIIAFMFPAVEREWVRARFSKADAPAVEAANKNNKGTFRTAVERIFFCNLTGGDKEEKELVELDNQRKSQMIEQSELPKADADVEAPAPAAAAAAAATTDDAKPSSSSSDDPEL